MRKILYVITKSNWGGAQRYVFDLATHVPQNEFDASVALGGTGGRDGRPGLLAQKLGEKNIRTIFVQSFMRDISVRREWQAFFELIKIFKEEKPDIVHLNSSKAGGLGAWAARIARVPHIIFTSHGLAWDEDRNFLARAALWLATWATFLLCHRVVVISQNNFERAGQLPFCKEKIRLIHNGIAPLQFKTRDEARRRLDILPEVFCVGTLSELTWNKGLHTLVRAAGILKRRGLEFVVCIAGEGEERKFLEMLIKEEGLESSVRLLGFVEHGQEYLPAFDIFTLTSVKEGLPYVLLEAAQARVPVVASRIAGVADIVGDNVSGLLFESKNAADLAEQLQKLIERGEWREKFAGALQKRVAQEFSLSRMVERTKELYQARG